MNLFFWGIWTLIPETFLHPFTDAREKARPRKHPIFLGHHARLAHFRQIGKAGVADDLLIHGGSIYTMAVGKARHGFSDSPTRR